MILRGLAAEGGAAFGRVLRTLGGKNIGKCRLRAHQHPLLPPLSNLQRARSIQNLQSKTRRQRAMERVLGDVLLPASILDFVPRLGNRCKDFPIYGLLRASILDLRGSIWESLQGFPTELVVSTVSASDSNLRCGKEEWFRLQQQSQRRSSASDSNLRCRRQEKS